MVPPAQESPFYEARQFDAVIFDLGGTLIYFDGDMRQIFTRAQRVLSRNLLEIGLQLDSEYFLNEFGRRMIEYYIHREAETTEYTTASILKALLEEMGHSGFPDEYIRPALQAMYAVTQAHWKIEADTVSTLQELKRSGYLLAIISNAGDDDDVQALIDKAGIRSFFEVIVTSAEVGIRKPNPVIFHAVLKRLGTSPQRSVMVGDRLGADVYGAQSAGMRGILINRRADRRANAVYQAQVAPDAVIESLSELPAVLNRLKG